MVSYPCEHGKYYKATSCNPHALPSEDKHKIHVYCKLCNQKVTTEELLLEVLEKLDKLEKESK